MPDTRDPGDPAEEPVEPADDGAGTDGEPPLDAHVERRRAEEQARAAGHPCVPFVPARAGAVSSHDIVPDTGERPREQHLPANLPVGSPLLIAQTCPHCHERFLYAHCASKYCPALYCHRCDVVYRPDIGIGHRRGTVNAGAGADA